MLKIKAAADRASLPIKTVRYYADIALVKPSGETGNGYRLFSNEDVARLIFVRRARAFGFSIEECRELLALYHDQERSSRDVKKIAEKKLFEIEEKLSELKLLRDELSHLASSCLGDERPDCPILSGLAGQPR